MTDALLARHSPADRVAFGSGGERTAADLLRDAAAVADALPEKTAARPLALLGVRRDVYASMAALLGAWARGYEVLIPPADATREGFLRMAQRADVGAVLHDTASSAALPIARIFENALPERRLSDLTRAQQGVLHFAPLEAAEAEPALRVTGTQLLREAASLGRSLALPERAAYACSLHTSTRYAWAAGVFWPLLCGGSFLRDDAREKAWAEQAARATHANAALGSRQVAAHEPAFLAIDDAHHPSTPPHDTAQRTGWSEPDAMRSPSQRTPKGEPAPEVAQAGASPRAAAVSAGWLERREATTHAGSSTPASAPAAGWVERGAGEVLLGAAPLESRGEVARARVVVMGSPAQLRLLLRRTPQVFVTGQWVVALGAPLVAAAFVQLRAAGLVVSDVFATQQLGCVAVRDAVDEGFRPLLEVSLRATADAAQLTAPQFADAQTARIPAAIAADGGFVPTGHRVQRAEWEERIAWMDGVQDAALLDARVISASRGFCLAVLLSGAAREERALKARVMTELPELELREWRSLRLRDVAPLPSASFASGRCDLSRNAAGRHDRAALLRLFGCAADGAPLSWELRATREQVAATRAVRYLQVPERYGYFTGHFPGYPLLPGAAQLSELVLPFVRAVRPELGRLTRMARLKFQERIVPNDSIEVSLTFGSASAEEHSVEFALKRGDSVCANGRLWFAAAVGGTAAAVSGGESSS